MTLMSYQNITLCSVCFGETRDEVCVVIDVKYYVKRQNRIEDNYWISEVLTAVITKSDIF